MFIPEILKENKRNMSFRDRKELIHGFQCINTDNSIAVIDCRIYAGKSRYKRKTPPCMCHCHKSPLQKAILKKFHLMEDVDQPLLFDDV
jgi:hypothetical protein